MTLGGWIIMIISVGTVTGLFVWSISRVLRKQPDPESMHGFEIETPDQVTGRDPDGPPEEEE